MCMWTHHPCPPISAPPVPCGRFWLTLLTDALPLLDLPDQVPLTCLAVECCVMSPSLPPSDCVHC